MNSALWVGILTAVTALVASYLTARVTSRAALAQARTTTTAEALRAERDRRRSSYREMLSCVHAFSVVCWRLPGIDATPDQASKDRLMTRMREDLGPTLSDMTRATHEVLLDGPAEVSASAERVRMTALRLQVLLNDLTEDSRADYDRMYQEFRSDYVRFIDLARKHSR